ncbi:MAG: ATP-binding cassette domain-containing protein [Campylobacterota bacterium]|nr:ATP-binding cassette domain-containing protein [Campylobacterota bacterium]
MINISNLHFKDIFKNINFSIEKQSNTIIYSGVNTGSTLFLKMIDGIVSNIEGEFIVDSINITNLSTEETLSHSNKVSFVYETNGLIHYLNIYDNIMLPLKKFKDYDEVLLNRLIDDFNIKNLLFKDPSELSDIELKLVNIVRAIVVHPKIILYDELDGGMDIDLLNSIISKLSIYQKELGFLQIFTTVKKFEFDLYKNFDNKYLLFNKTLERVECE